SPSAPGCRGRASSRSRGSAAPPRWLQQRAKALVFSPVLAGIAVNDAEKAQAIAKAQQQETDGRSQIDPEDRNVERRADLPRRVDEGGHAIAEPGQVQAENDSDEIGDPAQRQLQTRRDPVAPAIDADMAAALERKAKRKEDQEQAEQTHRLLDPGEVGGEGAA